jgi:beta-glucosidase
VTDEGNRLPFPAHFGWGAATAAHQVEGNNTNNDWWAFERRTGAISGGQKSGLACDWWNHAEQDFDRMAAMGHTTHRLSVEWSRVEPQEGAFDPKAIARYREMLQGLNRRGIQPMVTLFHFSSPLWLARKGGWSNPAVVPLFRRFVRYVVDQLGDLVGLWCTINEPNVYCVLGYVFGEHAPGRRSLPLYFRVLGRLLEAHATAYRVIRAVDGSARVGIVKNVQILEPLLPGDAASGAAARVLDYLFNGLVLNAVQSGRFGLPLGLGLSTHGPLVDSLDFFGLNYYYRLRLSPPNWKQGRFMLLKPTPGAEVSDSGREGPYGEVYPAGMYRALKRVSVLRKPIYVTENGLPDADDDQRPRFLLTHLAQVQRAIADGVDVRGYYHWSFTDNFEWAEGWDLRFGLIALDEMSQTRIPRPSAELYSRIIRANAITREMVEEYAPEALNYIFLLDQELGGAHE